MSTPLKRGDSAPPLDATLLGAGGAPQNLHGATVAFSMRAAGTTRVVVDRATASIVDETAGTVRYSWQAGDTDEAGDFEAEFTVTFADGSVATYPNDSYSQLTILDRVPA